MLSRIGRYVRDDLRASQRARIERHLQQCRHANVVLAELTEVNRALPALIVPVIFLAGAASPALWAATALAAGAGHGNTPTAGLEHSGGAAVSAATATGGTLAKLSAIAAAGALSAALVTTPTASVGPAIADRDHTQRDSNSSPRTGPSDLALGTSPAQPAPADANPTTSTGPALVTVPAAPDNPPAPIAAGPGTQPHRRRLWHHRCDRLGGDRHRLGPDTHDNHHRFDDHAPGNHQRPPHAQATSNHPAHRQPTTPTAPGAPAPPPGLRGLSNAMANVAAQNPKANSNALTALQNAAARLIDKQSPPPSP